MSDLVAFLEARLDDDERESQPQPEMRWSGGWHESDCSTYDYNVLDCDCALPARVLREVEAKRRIVELHSHQKAEPSIRMYPERGEKPFGCRICGDNDGVIWPAGWCATLRLLASVYADHPDYDEDWGKP